MRIKLRTIGDEVILCGICDNTYYRSYMAYAQFLDGWVMVCDRCAFVDRIELIMEYDKEESRGSMRYMP